jgi:hypothetical protein
MAERLVREGLTARASLEFARQHAPLKVRRLR